MVVIRLARGGSKNRPFYYITVADRRVSRNGRYIERLGYYNAHARGKEVRLTLDMPRFDYWVANGAQPSDRVASLVRSFKKNSPSEPQPEDVVATQAETSKDNA